MIQNYQKRYLKTAFVILNFLPYERVTDVSDLTCLDWMLLFSPNSYIEALTPQCDDIWRWGLWEVIRFRWDHTGGTPIMELVAFSEEKEIRVQFLSLSPSPMWGYSKKSAMCKSERRPSPTTKSAGIILDFLASRKVRNKCLLFKLPSPWYFVVVVQAELLSIPLYICTTSLSIHLLMDI